MTPEIVLGPPGTGKTDTLIRIAEGEIKGGTKPERIGLVSFTRRAAKEAVGRATETLGLHQRRFPYFCTLHSLCYRQLGLTPGDVLEGRALREFATWIGIRLSSRSAMWDEGGSWGSEPGDRILHLENLARVSGRTVKEQYDIYADDLPWSDVDRVSRGLAEYKRRRHLVDYTDMLQMWADSQSQVRLDVLLVDESQDLSILQWRVVDRLSAGVKRFVVAGDDDQAIYHWAGAALEHFVTMPGQASVLGQSWRVPQAVQDVATDVISRVHQRREKQWAPRPDAGVVDRWGQFDSVDVDGDDVLVLARNRFVLSEQVEPVLRQRGIIYEMMGRLSVDEQLLASVRTYEHLRAGGSATVEEVRAVHTLISHADPRGLPGMADDTVVTLPTSGIKTDKIWHEALDRMPYEAMSYLLAALRRGESTSRARVRLSTIHGAKGAQADHVVLLLEMARRTAEEAEEHPDDEARVWYVGVTRARQRLSVISAQGKYGYAL